jgi:hypothetical protein
MRDAPHTFLFLDSFGQASTVRGADLLIRLFTSARSLSLERWLVLFWKKCRRARPLKKKIDDSCRRGRAENTDNPI